MTLDYISKWQIHAVALYSLHRELPEVTRISALVSNIRPAVQH